MPPRDADALLEDLRAEATTWGQDEWWIAGEARKAPRLTAVYEMRVEDARAEALRMAGLDDDDDDAEDGGGSERVPPPGMRVAAERASAAVTAALGRRARDDLNQVALFDVRHDQMTSGASETIFMNFLSRSSRPTGPKMRVPRGSPSFFRMTAAFSSNLM